MDPGGPKTRGSCGSKNVVFVCRLLRIIAAQLTLVVKEELMVVERRGMFWSLPDFVTTVNV
jgi:hypothetical protein